MPRTAITLQEIGSLGKEDLTFQAADQANGMTMENDGRTFLIIKNDDASPKQVTVNSVADDNNRLGDLVQSVAASAIGIIYPSRGGIFNQKGATDFGLTQVDFDADTSLSLVAVRYKL